MRDRVIRNVELGAKPGEIPVNYVYTVGVAAEAFLREIKDHGRVLAARCPDCDITYLPSALFCERCFAGLEQTDPLPARGVVHTFTVASLDLDDQPLAEPVVWAFVAIDDTDGGLVHRLLTDPDDAYIGMPVEAEFLPPERRTGSIHDIVGFKPR